MPSKPDWACRRVFFPLKQESSPLVIDFRLPPRAPAHGGARLLHVCYSDTDFLFPPFFLLFWLYWLIDREEK